MVKKIIKEEHGTVSKPDLERLDELSEKVKKLEEIQEKTIKECDALKQAILREVFE